MTIKGLTKAMLVEMRDALKVLRAINGAASRFRVDVAKDFYSVDALIWVEDQLASLTRAPASSKTGVSKEPAMRHPGKSRRRKQ